MSMLMRAQCITSYYSQIFLALLFEVFLPQTSLLITMCMLDASPILGYPVLILKTTKGLKYKAKRLFGISSKGPIIVCPIAILFFTSLYRFAWKNIHVFS